MSSAAAAASELLYACAKCRNLHQAARLHAQFVESGLLLQSPFFAAHLISLYVRCGSLSKAGQVLRALPVRDVVCWSSVIGGYARHEQGHIALKCFENMQREGLSPDEVTFVCILKACANIRAIDKGMQIHDEIVHRGLLEKNVIIGTALVDMYAKCGHLTKAQQILDRLPIRNIVSWSALIAGYTQHGQHMKAINCFSQMQKEGLSPNEVTFSCILKACGSIKAIDMGEKVHNEIISRGLLMKSIVLGTALVDMYVKCNALTRAKRVLEQLPIRDTISWNALLCGYAQEEQGIEILDCFALMQREGQSPDEVTFISILKACASVRAIDKGKSVHDEIISRNLLKKSILLGSALVDMYAKCGMLERAAEVLQGLPVRDIISWNALIGGYAQNERGHKVLESLVQMEREGLSPDEVTLACVLKACGSLKAIEKGKQIHNEVITGDNLKTSIMVGTGLVDMYAKCGVFVKAEQVLQQLHDRDTVSWNALIGGYGQHCCFNEVLICFEKLQRDGLTPNEVTFLCLLNACTHTAKFDAAKAYYDNMSRKYGITPNLKHQACIIVAFGCIGDFYRAMSIAKTMPSSEVPSIWLSLLGACAKWGNSKFARLAFNQIIRLDEQQNEVR